MTNPLSNLVSIPATKNAGLASGTNNQNLFVTAQSLTFSGVTLIGGIILNFLTSNIGGSRLWVALVVAVVLGIVVTVVAANTPESNFASNKFAAIAIAVINTFALWISLYGISSIPLTGTPAS